MIFKRSWACILIAWLCMACVGEVAVDAGPQEKASDVLLAEVLEGQRASLSKMKNFNARFSLDSNIVIPGKTFKPHAIVNVTQQHDSKLVSCVLQQQMTDSTGTQTKTMSMNTLVNPDYIAHWAQSGNPSISIYERSKTDGAFPSNATTLLEATEFRDLMAWAYGMGNRMLLDAVEKRHPQTEVTARTIVETDKELVEISFSHMEIALQKVIVDPSRGYSVCRFECDNPRIHRTIEVSEIQPGIWFPASGTESYRDDGSGTTKESKWSVLEASLTVPEIMAPIEWKDTGYRGNWGVLFAADGTRWDFEPRNGVMTKLRESRQTGWFDMLH